jgi:hypothetical protein
MTTNELSVFRKNDFNMQYMNNRRPGGHAVCGRSIVSTAASNLGEGMDVGLLGLLCFV